MEKRVAPAAVLAAVAVDKPPRHALLLGAGARRSLWWLLVSLQLVNAAQLAFFASIYFDRDTPESLLWTALIYFIFADGFTFISRFGLLVAATYTLLSVAFAANGLRLVWLSLSQWSALLRNTAHMREASQPSRECRTKCAAVRGWIDRVGVAVSVHGSWFDLRLLTSEIFQLACETAAAYSSSRSISNAALNQIYGLGIFLSSVATLAFSRIFQHNLLQQRFACLLSDLVLGFVWGSLLPMWMYLPILEMFYGSLARTISDSETSSREIQRVFVLSWPSFAISIIPFVGSLCTVLEIQSILCDAATDPIPVAACGNLSRRPHPQRRWIKWAHGLVALYGCAVLVVSLSAVGIFHRIARQPQYDCVFRLYPWFSTKEACVQRRVNCSAVAIQGTANQIHAAIRSFDEGSLSAINLYGCTALEVDRSLARFSGLETIVIEDSWIAAWPISAGLTEDAFPALKTAKLLNVDTNTTLHGLVSVPLAKNIEYIRFNQVPNTATILASVGANWQHLIYLDCDRSDLVEVPHAVDAMYQLRTLSLMHSRIHTFRDDWIARWNLHLAGLWMNGNAELTELSETTWRQAASCAMFSMQNTNLSRIPDWVPRIAHRQFFVYAHGTPLCDTTTALLASIPQDVRALVVCEYTKND